MWNYIGFTSGILSRDWNDVSLSKLYIVFSGCEAVANFSFETDFTDSSKEMVYAGTELVSVQGGSAIFNGNGMVNMYRFANAEFKTDLVISFQFEAYGFGKFK